MLKLNVTLLWRTNDLHGEGMEMIEGVWGRASFVIAEDDLIEAAEIDDEVRMNRDRKWEWAEFSSQRTEVCDAIGYWAEQKGNLPSGIPICEKFGLPCEIKFTSYEVIGEEEEIVREAQ